MKVVLGIVGAFVLLLVCCGGGYAIFSGVGPPKIDTPAPVSPTTTEPGSPIVKPVAASGIPDGEWLIGEDYPAGTYRTPGPVADRMCYWQVTTTPAAQPGDPGFLKNDAPPGPARIVLSKGQYFTTKFCRPWVEVK